MSSQYTQEYFELKKEYTAQGFKSLTDFLLAQKNKSKPEKKKLSNSVKVKVSDINSGCVVGFTKEGYSIVASKKTTKGVVTISYHLHSDEMYGLASRTRKNFATVKQMIDEINTIIDEEKTKQLAWW